MTQTANAHTYLKNKNNKQWWLHYFACEVNCANVNEFIHSNKILHRDMKASNVLITKSGVLRLADFGLRRAIHTCEEKQRNTNCVVTLWCRPSNLLMGERDFGPPIDMTNAPPPLMLPTAYLPTFSSSFLSSCIPFRYFHYRTVTHS